MIVTERLLGLQPFLKNGSELALRRLNIPMPLRQAQGRLACSAGQQNGTFPVNRGEIPQHLSSAEV